MKKSQLVKLGLTLGLVGAVGVGGTLAILSQQSKDVVNTFEVGAGLQANDIWLDETNLAGKPLDSAMSDEERTTEGNAYNDLQPGMRLTKDPQVHITAKAADSYVFAKLENVDEYLKKVNNGVAKDKKSSLINGINENWQVYQLDKDATYDGVYVYVGETNEEKGIEATEDEGSKVSVGDKAFDSEKIFEGIELTTSAALYEADGTPKNFDDEKIVVKALAVQATKTSSSWNDAKEVVDKFTWPANK